jgi:flagellar basal body-associated protein FliL
MASPASEKRDDSASGSSGGIKAMLPLILNIVLMPVIAFLMTQFVLLPALNKSSAAPKGGEAAAPAGDAHGDGHGSSDHGAGAPAEGDHGGGGGHGSDAPLPGSGGSIGASAITVMMDAVTVNVSGTMGSRLMMAKIGLRGNSSGLKTLVDNRKDDLRDAASTLLGTKTLMDIERQGFRNTVKAELKASFLKLLGQGAFTDVVIPELAIQ